MIYIDYNKNTDKILFNLWYKHYQRCNIDFKIFSSDNSEIIYYPYHEYYINYIPDNNELILTEYDFLYSYTVKNTDIEDLLELSYNINNKNLSESLIIGRIFYVPIQNKKPYTTFEIPDFIIYGHSDHTNYKTNGIKLKNGCIISTNIVCLNMRVSNVAYEMEYYENNILYCNYNKELKYLDSNIFANIYVDFADNIITHKELKYAIIWHPKCGCSTICNILKKINNIKIFDPHLISANIPKYRYNNYLQNIDIISFVRNPYMRFLSAYFDKHVLKRDIEYLERKQYIKYIDNINIDNDTLFRLTKYIIDKNIFIDNHTRPITELYYNIYIKNIFFEYTIVQIENGLEENLYTFLLKYHNNDLNNENNIHIDNMTPKDESIDIHMNDYKNYNVCDWKKYYVMHNVFPNYISILVDNELKECIYKIYSNDFIHFNYSREIIKNNDTIYSKINTLLPHDFDINMYRQLNKDVYNYSDIELKLHYIKSGEKEGRIYRLEKNLPIDFDVDMYREINIDLINYSDDRLKKHYIIAGIKEGRHYKIDMTFLPEDFDADIYRELNRDLYNYSNIGLKLHYIKSGKKEKRFYKIDYNLLPENFNVEMYRELNIDLRSMNNIELILHYIRAGKNENRIYNDIYFIHNEFCQLNNISDSISNTYSLYTSDIRLQKNYQFISYIQKIFIKKNYKYILLVNHDNKTYGASHYLYKLYNVLMNKYINKKIEIILCEIEYNNEIYKKYNIDIHNNIVEYKNDPTLLYMIYEKYTPKIMYINSCNYAIYKITKYIPDHIKLVHSHEIFDHYLLNKEIIPTYVVSNRIASQYYTYCNEYPCIQPPIFDKNDIHTIISLSNETILKIQNNYGTIDNKRITICMCGQISDRKNYKLFIEISKKFLEYNFLWIGGNEEVFIEYENIYHIHYTINPYKYFYQIVDYFILFSNIDPCPYVILENILLGTPTIVFDKNIFYEHEENKLYISIKESITIDTVTYAIHEYVKKKKINDAQLIEKNVHYIEKNFKLSKDMIELMNKKLNN